MSDIMTYVYQENYIKFLESEVYRLNDQILRMKDQRGDDPINFNLMDMECPYPPLNMSVRPTIPLQARIESKPVSSIDTRTCVLLRYGNYKQALYFDDDIGENVQIFGVMFERFFQEFVDSKIDAVKLGVTLKNMKSKKE